MYLFKERWSAQWFHCGEWQGWLCQTAKPLRHGTFYTNNVASGEVGGGGGISASCLWFPASDHCTRKATFFTNYGNREQKVATLYSPQKGWKISQENIHLLVCPSLTPGVCWYSIYKNIILLHTVRIVMGEKSWFSYFVNIRSLCQRRERRAKDWYSSARP